MVVTIPICVALILCGAVEAKPIGWVVILFAVLAFLMAVGAPHLGFGR